MIKVIKELTRDVNIDYPWWYTTINSLVIGICICIAVLDWYRCYLGDISWTLAAYHSFVAYAIIQWTQYSTLTDKLFTIYAATVSYYTMKEDMSDKPESVSDGD